MNRDTICVQGGYTPGNGEPRQIPIIQSTTFKMCIRDSPWNGPIGGVQVGLVDGEIVLNPTQEQRKKSDLALTVAATMDKICLLYTSRCV